MKRRQSIAVLCIAVISLAALVPASSALVCALVEPEWRLLPDLPRAPAPPVPPIVDEQPRSLLALLPSRAPPAPLT